MGEHALHSSSHRCESHNNDENRVNVMVSKRRMSRNISITKNEEFVIKVAVGVGSCVAVVVAPVVRNPNASTLGSVRYCADSDSVYHLEASVYAVR